MNEYQLALFILIAIVITMASVITLIAVLTGHTEGIVRFFQ